MSTPVWLPSSNFLAQAGHALLGACLTLLGFVLGALLWYDVFWCALIGSGLFYAYMFPKEFIFDILVEEQTAKNGWYDLFWGTVGVGTTWALIAVFALIGLYTRWA